MLLYGSFSFTATCFRRKESYFYLDQINVHPNAVGGVDIIIRCYFVWLMNGALGKNRTRNPSWWHGEGKRVVVAGTRRDALVELDPWQGMGIRMEIGLESEENQLWMSEIDLHNMVWPEETRLREQSTSTLIFVSPHKNKGDAHFIYGVGPIKFKLRRNSNPGKSWKTLKY